MQEQLLDLLSAFGPNSDPEVVRNVLLSAFPDLMTAFGDTAAVIGADFYDQVRNLPVSAGTFQTVFAQPAKVKQSEGVVRWAAGSLFGEAPSWESFQSALLGSSQRLLMQPARETIDLQAQADAKSGKVAAVRWERRLSGSENCDFCRMLAGRGVVYRSGAAAGAVVGRGTDSSIALDEDGNRRAGFIGGVGGDVKARGSQALAASYHDNCDCVAVPTFYTREVQTFNVRGYDQRESVLVPIAN